MHRSIDRRAFIGLRPSALSLLGPGIFGIAISGLTAASSPRATAGVASGALESGRLDREGARTAQGRPRGALG